MGYVDKAGSAIVSKKTFHLKPAQHKVGRYGSKQNEQKKVRQLFKFNAQPTGTVVSRRENKKETLDSKERKKNL